MTHSVYTWTSPSSAAVKQVQLNGPQVAVSRTRVAGSFPGTTVNVSRMDTGHVVGFNVAGDGGADPVAGDVLLVVAVCPNSGGQAVSPPAGWTTLTPIVGLGTHDVLVSAFWKVATTGDVTSTLTFTAASSTNIAVYVMTLPQAYIDNTNPVLAEASVVSAADVMTIDGPTTTGPGTPRFSVFEWSGSIFSPASGDVDDDSRFYFMDQGNDGVGGNGTTAPGLLGWRYYFDPSLGWSIDDIRF